MSGSIQNSHTSLLPIYSKTIAPAGTAVVLISTTTNVGQIVTVRDMDGFLSSPQQILVSTTPGVTINGASTPVSLKQGFGYLTLRAKGTAAWTTIDTTVLNDPNADYTLRGVSYSTLTITGSIILTDSTITTAAISTNTGQFKTMTVGGQTNASTFQVNAPASGTNRADVSGGSVQPALTTSSMTATGNLQILGTLTAANSALGDSVSSLQGAAITGNFTASTLTVAGQLSTAYQTTVNQTMTVAGQATLGSQRVNRTLTASTVNTGLLQTTTTTIDQLFLSTAGSYVSRTDIPISDPSYTSTTNPTVFTALTQATPTLVASWLTASTFTTANLNISTAVSSPACTDLRLGAAAISAGAITVSSATIGTGTFTNTPTGPAGGRLPVFGTANVTVSTAATQYEFVTASATAPFTYITLLNANTITTSTVNTGTVITKGDSFTFSTVFISSGLVTAELSSLVAPVARIQNTTGQTTTSSMFTSSATVSSLTGVQTLTASPPSTLTFSTPSVTISSAQVSTATAGAATTSSLQAVTINLGSLLNYSTLGPTDPWVSTTVSTGIVYDTTYEYTQGIGTPYQPLRIHATTDRTVNLYLRNVSSFSTTYFTANMTYRNDSSISGVAGLRIVNTGGTSTIISFNANPIVGFQKQSLSNYVVDLNTAASTTTYWLAGPNTLSGPSTSAAYQPLLAGGNAPAYLALNVAGDTASWSAVASPPFTTATYAAAWNGSNLWLAGGEGTNHLAYSYNGSNWQSISTGLFTSVRALAWNGKLWVAGGTGTHTLAYSYDGFSWTGLGTSTFSASTNTVAWNGQLWLAGGVGTNSLGYSYDGIRWGGLGRSTFTEQCYGITWGASTNTWVAAGGPSSIQLAYSYNGIQWFPGSVSTFTGATSYGYCVGWNGSQFVAGGDSNIAYSADGANWTKVGVSTIMSTVRAATWTGTQWCIGGTYTTHALATSSTATTWTGITASTLFTRANVVASRVPVPIDLSANDLLVAGQTTMSYSLTAPVWNSTFGAISTLNGVAMGRDAVVATGKGKATDPSGSYLVLIEFNGRTYYSTDDGSTWTYSGQSLSSSGGVAFNGSLWVATTEFNGIWYSLNGISWTAATLPGGSGTDYRGVAYGNGQWIAVGNGNGSTVRVLTSTNGITWSVLTGANNLLLAFGFRVTYAGGIWIISAGGSGNPNSVIYSYDGINWARSATASSNYGNTPNEVAWNGNRYIIVGSGTFGVMLSDDGVTWTGSSTAQAILNTYSVSPTTVATNGTVWVVGFFKPSSSNAAGIMYSLDDGATWTEVPGVSSLMGVVTQVIWNGYYFIASGQTQVGSFNVLRSADGISWSGAALITGYFLQAIACRVPKSILNGQTILTSVNRGLTWRITDQGGIFTQGRAAAWNGYLWVAVGDANTNAIAYSLDGITWTGVTGTGLATSFSVVAWDGASWYVYGSGTNRIATSPDGITWTGQGAGLAPTTCAAYNGSNLWVGGSTGANTLMTSANGITWTGQGNTTFNTIVRAVAWNGSKWTAVGGAAALATSVNGTTWTTAGAPTLDTASGVVWTGKQWVALGTSTIAVAPAPATGWSTFTVSSLSTNSKLASANPLPYGFADSNIMFAGSSNATNRFAISMNGTAWIPISSVTAAVNTVSWNGRFWTFGLGAAPAIQVMNSNFILSTPTQTSFNLTTTKGIAWGSQLGLAVGQGTSARHIAYTTDSGLTWSANRNNATPFFFFDTAANGIAFGSNLWVAVGQEATLTQCRGIRFSANGINWSTPSTTAGRGILLGCAVAYYSSIWVVGGSTIAGTNDTLAVSANGSTWNYLSNTTFSVAARGIAWGTSNFVAVGEGTNTIAYSPDGSNWTGVGTSIFSTRGHSVAWNGRYFVALGEGTNTLAYSANGITWTGAGTTTFNAMATGGIAARSLLPPVKAEPTPTANTTPPKTFNWSLTAMTELSQTSVQKPAAGSPAWNARAASAEAFTASAWLSFQPAQTTAEIMFGLSENPTATLSYTALNYAFYMTSGGNLRIYELGTQVAVIGSYATTDILRITFDGTTVRYYQNSTLVRSVARAVGAALYMSSSFFTPTGTIQAIDFHPLYTLTPVKPALSTTGYAVTQTTGTQVDQFGPFYLTLTSNLLPSQFNIYATMNGTATSTNSFYADIFINETKYFSTNVITPVYSTLSTYILSFSNATAVNISTTALLDVRFRATRATGDTYLYTNWTDTSGVQQRSSATIQNTYNPNGIEYLQFYHTTFGSGLQTSELDIYVGPTSTLSTYLNSNAGIDMYSGLIRWSSSVNATVIENRYNDTQTRSLTYSGALYNASDPRLKEDIVDANGEAMYETMKGLPLKRYRFNTAYQETYRTEDRTQLGVLTTDIQGSLVNAVTPGPAGFDTVDRAQIRFAHMAATQALAARISCLRARIEAAVV